MIVRFYIIIGRFRFILFKLYEDCDLSVGPGNIKHSLFTKKNILSASIVAVSEGGLGSTWLILQHSTTFESTHDSSSGMH